MKLKNNKLIKIIGYAFYRKMPVFYPENFFKNKIVSIVGPASELEGRSLGPDIDEADVVIKFNRMIDFGDDIAIDFGKRCDIVFHGLLPGKRVGRCGKIQPINWKKKSLRAIVYPYHLGGRSYFSLGFYFIKGGGGIKTYKIATSDYKDLEFKLSARPTSGLSAIEMAIKGKASIINVYGFSFFKTSHHSSYFQGKQNILVDASRFNHSPDKEFEYVKGLNNENETTLNFVYPNPFAPETERNT